MLQSVNILYYETLSLSFNPSFSLRECTHIRNACIFAMHLWFNLLRQQLITQSVIEIHAASAAQPESEMCSSDSFCLKSASHIKTWNWANIYTSTSRNKYMDETYTCKWWFLLTWSRMTTSTGRRMSWMCVHTQTGRSYCICPLFRLLFIYKVYNCINTAVWSRIHVQMIFLQLLLRNAKEFPDQMGHLIPLFCSWGSRWTCPEYFHST